MTALRACFFLNRRRDAAGDYSYDYPSGTRNRRNTRGEAIRGVWTAVVGQWCGNARADVLRSFTWDRKVEAVPKKLREPCPKAWREHLQSNDERLARGAVKMVAGSAANLPRRTARRAAGCLARMESTPNPFLSPIVVG